MVRVKVAATVAALLLALISCMKSNSRFLNQEFQRADAEHVGWGGLDWNMSRAAVSSKLGVDFKIPSRVDSLDDLGSRIEVGNNSPVVSVQYDKLGMLYSVSMYFDDMGDSDEVQLKRKLKTHLMNLYGDPETDITQNGIRYTSWKNDGALIAVKYFSERSDGLAFSYKVTRLPGRKGSVRIAKENLERLVAGEVVEFTWRNVSVGIMKRTNESPLLGIASSDFEGPKQSIFYAAMKDELNAMNVNRPEIDPVTNSIKEDYGVYVLIGPEKFCPVHGGRVKYSDFEGNEYSRSVFIDSCTQEIFNSHGYSIAGKDMSPSLLIPPHYYTESGDLIIGVTEEGVYD